MIKDTRILILGLGNVLLQDEGLGVRTLHQLNEAYVWPDNVILMDGGVMGLDLLPHLEDADAVLIIDAVRSGQLPGSLIRLTNGEIPTTIAQKYSVHQVGLQETLAMAQFRGTLPGHIVLWGIEPDKIALGMRFSPSIAAQMPALTQAILCELKSWGIVLVQKPYQLHHTFGLPEQNI